MGVCKVLATPKTQHNLSTELKSNFRSRPLKVNLDKAHFKLTFLSRPLDLNFFVQSFKVDLYQSTFSFRFRMKELPHCPSQAVQSVTIQSVDPQDLSALHCSSSDGFGAAEHSCQSCCCFITIGVAVDDVVVVVVDDDVVVKSSTLEKD